MNYLENLNTSQEIQNFINMINQVNKVRAIQGQRRIKTAHYKLMNVLPSISFIPVYITLTGTALYDVFWI